MLTVSAPPSFNMRLLMPRTQLFLALHPDVDLNITTRMRDPVLAGRSPGRNRRSCASGWNRPTSWWSMAAYSAGCRGAGDRAADAHTSVQPALRAGDGPLHRPAGCAGLSLAARRPWPDLWRHPVLDDVAAGAGVPVPPTAIASPMPPWPSRRRCEARAFWLARRSCAARSWTAACWWRLSTCRCGWMPRISCSRGVRGAARRRLRAMAGEDAVGRSAWGIIFHLDVHELLF